MRLTFTKKQRARMIEVLEQDFEDADDAAVAVLDRALELLAERAQFTIAAQVKAEDGDKIALGLYPNERQATEDALKLAYSTQTHEEHKCWVLPIWWGTPAGYYAERKKQREATAMRDKSPFEAELQRRVRWLDENPGQTPPEEWGVIPFNSQWESCWLCDGLGRVPKAEVIKED